MKAKRILPIVTTCSVLVAIAAVSVLPSFTPATTKQEPLQSIVVYDFSNKGQINQWKPSGGVSIEMASSGWPGKKGNFARINFKGTDWNQINVANMSDDADKGDSENPAPPPAIHTRNITAPIPQLQNLGVNLAAFDFFEFDTYNPGNKIIHYNIGFNDVQGRSRSQYAYVTLAPKERKTVRLALRKPPFSRVDEINRFTHTNSNRARQFELQIPYNPEDVEFFVSDFKLVVNPINELSPGGSTSADGRSSGFDKLISGAIKRVAEEAEKKDAGLGKVTAKALNTVRESINKNIVEIKQTEQNAISAQASEIATGGFALGVESSMKQVFLEKNRFSGDFSHKSSYKIFAAKNESESFQVVIYPTNGALSDVSFTLTPLKSKTGHTIPASASMVGYVQTKVKARYLTSLGWYPDPILDYITTAQNVPENEVLPIWIKVDVPKNAQAGTYSGTLTIKSSSGTQNFTVETEVWDFELPTTSNLNALFQFYRLNSMSRFAAPKEPANTYNSRYAKQTELFENWLLRYRVQPGNIYSGAPPNWDAARLKDLVSQGLNAVNLSYVRIDRKQAANFNEAEHWKRVEEQIAAIKKYVPILQEVGIWSDDKILKYILLFDEWPGSEIDIVYRTAKRLKEVFPNIKLVTTAYDFTYGLNRPDGDLIDIWIPHVNVLQNNAMLIDYARRQGREFGWYFAVGAYAPLPNFWIENNPIQSRLGMGTLSYKYNTPLFLYWAINRWFNNDPATLTNGPKTAWNPMSYGTKAKDAAHGEGSLFYARKTSDGLGTTPVSSIRLENFRDGMEDYEYFVLLETLRKKKGNNNRVEIKPEVLYSVVDYTTNPHLVEEQRKRVAEEILQLR